MAAAVGDLQRRAGVHAALADPTRLAIVDSLLAGDASPSELQALLSMPSNLMAHHVGVLERAGVILRSRSEGDRRRVYLSVVPAALDALAPTVARRAARVVFVCTQNSARSQLAAALWRRRSRVPAASAGTDPAPHVHRGAVAAARRHQLPLRPVTPRHLDDVLRADDLVIVVCDNAHEELGADTARLHWSVADPARAGTAAAFDRALADLTHRVARFAPTVSPPT
ncbi:MAG TPA: helix-turn-helix domain-containing protein [Actinophytocola sp.]|uniref:arsenate reductase/protein-tyrosine-phosphatase family protein n=1 Tax=Actinophytocola sp. TaxID=1872138 RepID=UPI002DBBE3C0|nr:helix-turn-helix domain-containing protein [Actinophytocola sp.]HEU5470638.1 helix-turn-helix domain-containing protein [Actinophytocola sp.]